MQIRMPELSSRAAPRLGAMRARHELIPMPSLSSGAVPELGAMSDREYRIHRTPSDDAEEIWRLVRRIQATASTPQHWAELGVLVPIAQIAFLRAIEWRLGALEREKGNGS